MSQPLWLVLALLVVPAKMAKAAKVKPMFHWLENPAKENPAKVKVVKVKVVKAERVKAASPLLMPPAIL